MTEQEKKIIHAFVEPEGCWHTWIPDYFRLGSEIRCLHCNCREYDDNGFRINSNPTYTDDTPFNNFLRVLFSDAMYETFEYHAGNAWAATGTQQFLIPWLFSDHDRFLRLFLDFLSLEGTQIDFGYMECPESCEAVCDITRDKCPNNPYPGQVPRPWLRAWKEGK